MDAQPLSLSSLKSRDEYLAERGNIFPSSASLQWFLRTNRQLLVDADALHKPNGVLKIAPEQFDAVVLQVGRSRMGGVRNG